MLIQGLTQNENKESKPYSGFQSASDIRYSEDYMYEEDIKSGDYEMDFLGALKIDESPLMKKVSRDYQTRTDSRFQNLFAKTVSVGELSRK